MLQVLLLAFRAFLGEQNCAIQQVSAARRECYEQRSRSRRRVSVQHVTLKTLNIRCTLAFVVFNVREELVLTPRVSKV